MGYLSAESPSSHFPSYVKKNSLVESSRAGGVAQVVEHLHSECKSQSSNPSTTTTTKK
jgi:hypothetical protein